MGKQPLPNSNSILTLGVLSIIGVLFCGIGLILGIIAIIQYNTAHKLYLERPEKYLLGGEKIGKNLAVIGVILNIIVILIFVIFGALGVLMSEFLPKGNFM